MRVAGVEDVKDLLEELMDSYVAMNKMACMFPKGSKDRAFYLGKVQAYEDAIGRLSALIEGDGYDDKWYVQREAEE